MSWPGKVRKRRRWNKARLFRLQKLFSLVYLYSPGAYNHKKAVSKLNQGLLRIQSIPYICFYYISLPVNYLVQYIEKDSPSENTQSICFLYISQSFNHLLYFIRLQILCYRDYTVHMLHIYSTVNHLLYVIILQQILLQRFWSPYVSQGFYYLLVIYYIIENFFAEAIQSICFICISLCFSYSLYFSPTWTGH